MQFIPVLAPLTFAAQETLISIFKTVALLSILVETMIINFFRILYDSKELLFLYQCKNLYSHF